VTKRKKTKLGN